MVQWSLKAFRLNFSKSRRDALVLRHENQTYEVKIEHLFARRRGCVDVRFTSEFSLDQSKSFRYTRRGGLGTPASPGFDPLTRGQGRPMQSLLRITIARYVCRCGDGVAISPRCRQHQATRRVRLIFRRALDAETGRRGTSWTMPIAAKPAPIPEPAPAPLPVTTPVVMAPAPPPVYAPHYGPVANQLEAFEKAIDKLQAATERNGNVVAEALQELKQPPRGCCQHLGQSDPRLRLAPGNLPRLKSRLPSKVSRRSREEGDNTLSLDVQNSDLRNVLQQISAQAKLNILTSKSVTGNVSAVLTDVDVFTRRRCTEVDRLSWPVAKGTSSTSARLKTCTIWIAPKTSLPHASIVPIMLARRIYSS